MATAGIASSKTVTPPGKHRQPYRAHHGAHCEKLSRVVPSEEDEGDAAEEDCKAGAGEDDEDRAW
ncbi:hypothetical protein GCM10022214_02540 [Actinomadura miaoliensis]|uniref:Uncharacterized protein n=1 Tax=Actinomadura miaoliensis TaxID=430685 RepID=A0ABP7UXU3_9ACTN